MKSGIMFILAGSLMTATIAYAAEPQEERQQIMKQVGGAMGSLAKMAKGEMDYDADAAKKAFQQMHEAAMKFGDHFPEGSETGFETEASPSIWTDREEFDAKLAKFQEDSAQAADTVGEDASDLGKKLAMVGQNCGSCHQTFRVKNN